MNKPLLFIFLLTLTTLSCKTTKTPVALKKNASAGFVDKKMAESEIECQWFSGKIKADFSDPAPINSLNATVRLRTDSIIWLSISPMLGIEIARILITKDSIKILDRLNKQFLVKDFDFINSMIPFHLDFSLMQKMILGQKIFYNKKAVKVNTEDNYYILTSSGDDFKNMFYIFPGHFTLYKMQAEHLTDNLGLTITFDNYKKIGDRYFSFNREMNFKSRNEFVVSLKYSNIKLDEPFNFPFQIPQSYDTIR